MWICLGLLEVAHKDLSSLTLLWYFSTRCCIALHPTLGIVGMGGDIFDYHDDWEGIVGSYRAGVRDANHSMIHRTIPFSKEVFCLRDKSRHEFLTIPSNVTKSLSSLSGFYIIVSSGKIKPQSPKVPTMCLADVIASGVEPFVSKQLLLRP